MMWPGKPIAHRTQEGDGVSSSVGPDQLVTIRLERWRWDQVLQCLDRYVIWLRGDDERMDELWDDVEWVDQLDAMSFELRNVVNSGGNIPNNIGGR
jgi:hypothetical protein